MLNKTCEVSAFKNKMENFIFFAVVYDGVMTSFYRHRFFIISIFGGLWIMSDYTECL